MTIKLEGNNPTLLKVLRSGGSIAWEDDGEMYVIRPMGETLYTYVGPVENLIHKQFKKAPLTADGLAETLEAMIKRSDAPF